MLLVHGSLASEKVIYADDNFKWSVIHSTMSQDALNSPANTFYAG